MSPQSRAMVACLLTQCFTLPETDEAAKAIQSLRRIADLQLGRMRKLTRPSVARMDRLATIANALRERLSKRLEALSKEAAGLLRKGNELTSQRQERKLRLEEKAQGLSLRFADPAPADVR